MAHPRLRVMLAEDQLCRRYLNGYIENHEDFYYIVVRVVKYFFNFSNSLATKTPGLKAKIHHLFRQDLQDYQDFF